jgi:dCTP deaminase
MAFWRYETLKEQLRTLITPAEAFDERRIDCAAYTLTLGSEVFITTDLPEVGGADEGVKRILEPGEQIRITPGQFAFLVSRETVEVPDNAIAFISMKATYKLRGLINVSGFHVDPGWKNPLLFSVYNAGPSPVCLTQGMPLFLIWYASLDGTTKRTYSGKGKAIDDELISNMSGQVFSPIALKQEVGRLHDDLRVAANNVVRVETALSTVSTIAWRAGLSVVVLLIGAVGYLFKEMTDARVEVAKLQGRIAAIENPKANAPTATTSAPLQTETAQKPGKPRQQP